MKCFLTVIFSLFILSTANSQTASIKAGKFILNKAKITPTWKIAPVTAVIKSEDRRREGFNTTHTYDDLGIVLFEKNGTDKTPTGVISEVQFWFSAGEVNQVTPSGLFTGSMQVEQLKVTRNLTVDDMKLQLKNYKQTDSYMEHNYRMAYKGLYIYFQFNEDEDRLIKMSIGPDKSTN